MNILKFFTAIAKIRFVVWKSGRVKIVCLKKRFFHTAKEEARLSFRSQHHSADVCSFCLMPQSFRLAWSREMTFRDTCAEAIVTRMHSKSSAP